ncbi:2271_t:CDS:2, partial [Scutellospora calospora]
LSEWRTIMMNPPELNEKCDIKRSFAFANEMVKMMQIPLSNSQKSTYTSKLINTREIKRAYESFNVSICRDSRINGLSLSNISNINDSVIHSNSTTDSNENERSTSTPATGIQMLTYAIVERI